jgi:hypothetical protein
MIHSPLIYRRKKTYLKKIRSLKMTVSALSDVLSALKQHLQAINQSFDFALFLFDIPIIILM